MVGVLRAGGLGDTLLTLPAVQALRSSPQTLRGPAGPPRTIAAIGYPAFWRAAGPLIDRALPIDDPRFAGLYTDTPGAALAEWLSGQHLLVAWTARPLGGWVERAGPRLIEASPYPPPGMHAATWLLDTLTPLFEHLPRGAPDGGWLGLTPMERALGTSLLRGLGLERPTILHPGAGAVWKRWPASSFARLALLLRKRGHQVALVEGPADEDAVGAVLAETGAQPVIREPDLRTLAQMLASARLFVGNDSGVTHLAAMAGAPTIALFGPTDPVSWAQLGNVRVLRRCRRHAVRQGEIRVCDDPACMAGIAVEEVLEVIDIHC